jgi:hypothetical protein
MSATSKVAVLRTRPATILRDYQRLFELAGGAQALAANTTTILKDNISWHYPMPAASTTPWQLEGAILALRQAGFHDRVCVQNQTVLTNAFKGEDLNGYVPIFKHYQVPALYNFRTDEMQWILYRPNAKRRTAHTRVDLRLSRIVFVRSAGIDHDRRPTPRASAR